MRTYKSHRCIGALHTVSRAGKKPATHYSTRCIETGSDLPEPELPDQ